MTLVLIITAHRGSQRGHTGTSCISSSDLQIIICLLQTMRLEWHSYQLGIRGGGSFPNFNFFSFKNFQKMIVVWSLLISLIQATIEDSLGGELSFAVQPGDVVLRYVSKHAMVHTCQNTLSMSILRPLKQLIINSSNSETSVWYSQRFWHLGAVHSPRLGGQEGHS